MLSTANNFQKEITFSIASESELMRAFRLRDQKKLVLPQGLEYPLNVRSYFTWKESSGVYTYLIFKAPNWDLPKGVVFKRTTHAGEQTGGLCNWCHAYGSSEEIGMMSVSVNSEVSFSYFICLDLSCIEKIEEATELAGKDPEKYIHQLYHRIEKLFEGLSSYKLE